MKFDFKKNLPHIISIIVILVINLVYFMPQFQGKQIQQGDIISHKGMVNEARTYEEKTGEEVFWTNSMFGGMPMNSMGLKHKNNVAQFFEKVFKFGFKGPAGMFILGMISFYICMILLRVNPWVSLIFSILFALSTSNLMLTGAGHNTKVRAIMASAPIIAGMLLVMKGRTWLGLLAFTLFLGVNIQANHPQMTYYLGMIMAIYMLVELVSAIKNKALAGYGKSAGLLLLGSVVALGLSASKLMPIYEYGKQTMRGDAILKADSSSPQSSSTKDGLGWDYAMGWSGGVLDVISVFIPRAAGGGTVEEVGSDTKFAKVTGQRKARVPVYFGSLPSTAGPYYFGAIVFLLFILGLLIIKGKVKWWLASGVFITFLMSMGKNFAILNEPMFNYLPLFSKFRTPNSVLSITGLLLVILAALTFDKILKTEKKEELLKPLLISIGALGGFSLLFAFIGPSMVSFDSAYDARFGVTGKILDACLEDRAGMLRSSALRTFGLIALAGGLIYLFLKSKISKTILLPIIGLLAVGDMLIVSKPYFGADNYVNKRNYKNNFEPRPVDKQILQDKDPHFRVQDFSVDTYNSASTSYHLKTVGGYSPVKLQRIDDVISRHLNNRSQQNPYGNQKVLNMLNTKYFIVPGQNNTATAQRNPSAIGNAWMVENIQYVDDANSEIDALNNFDPLTTAIVNAEFKEALAGFDPTKSGTINLTKYSPNELTYAFNASSDQLVVFSEIWYGPNLGWQAYIDDQPVDHIRANYLLRALKVPAGNHNIKFTFKPDSRITGGMISLISSVLLLLLIAGVGYKLFKEKKIKEE